MSGLSDINTALIVNAIRKDLHRILADMIYYDEHRARIKAQTVACIEEYLHHLRGRQAIWDGSATGSIAVGWNIDRRGTQCTFTLDNGSVYHVRKKFRSRRTARVYGKRNWRGFMAVDMLIKPITPVDTITINAVVNRI